MARIAYELSTIFRKPECAALADGRIWFPADLYITSRDRLSAYLGRYLLINYEFGLTKRSLIGSICELIDCSSCYSYSFLFYTSNLLYIANLFLLWNSARERQLPGTDWPRFGGAFLCLGLMFNGGPRHSHHGHVQHYGG